MSNNNCYYCNTLCPEHCKEHLKECKKLLGFSNTIRKLWEQHVMWTRSFIISSVDKLDDLQLVTERLLRNPADFAKVLRRFYNQDTVQRFQDLLTEHLTIAADLVNAAIAKKSDKVKALRKKWYQNAEEIALFLDRINPCWSENKWRTMLFEHLEITEEEAVTRINSQNERNIAIYDEIEQQALEMGDMMSEGIIKQFGVC